MKSEFALQVGPTARPRPPHRQRSGDALEVETLYTNGPAGGGGVFKSAKDTVAIEVDAHVRGVRDAAHPICGDWA